MGKTQPHQGQFVVRTVTDIAGSINVFRTWKRGKNVIIQLSSCARPILFVTWVQKTLLQEAVAFVKRLRSRRVKIVDLATVIRSSMNVPPIVPRGKSAMGRLMTGVPTIYIVIIPTQYRTSAASFNLLQELTVFARSMIFHPKQRR